MERSSRYLISLLLMLGLLSAVYFFGLALSLPLVAVLLITVGIGFLVFRYLLKNLSDVIHQPLSGKLQLATYLVFITGLYLIVDKGSNLAVKHGEWDAWAIWNLHAKYLADEEHWQRMLDVSVSPHPDYPLFLPTIVAFFWRLLGANSWLIPFAVTALVTLLIPVTVFLSLYRRNLFVAGVLLLWFATDEFYLARGLSQYADQWLALFFLQAFVTKDAYKATGEARYLVFTGAFLALAGWTKNEGLLLALIFALFYFRVFVKPATLKYLLAGVCVPAIAWLVFKLWYAPATDLVAQTSVSSLELLKDSARTDLIRQYLERYLKESFCYHKIALLLYAIHCVWERKLPSKDLVIIAVCLGGYLMVYQLTPMDLEWHIHTSMSRLLFQPSPAFIYVGGRRLARVRLQLVQE